MVVIVSVERKTKQTNKKIWYVLALHRDRQLFIKDHSPVLSQFLILILTSYLEWGIKMGLATNVPQQ